MGRALAGVVAIGLVGCSATEPPTPVGVVAGCGNGQCEAGENHEGCPQDCLPLACGNGSCEPGENPFNCAADCQAACGNGSCESGESPSDCPQDCQDPCGDGECTGGENPFNCPQDCETATCGNGECEVGEDPDSCPQDCQGSVCGNGECEVGEDVGSCPQDCSGTACGNGECEVGEDVDSCPEDCAAAVCGNGECEFGEDVGSCPQDCSGTACGNGECEVGEDVDSCPQDCAAAVCGNGECEFGEDPEVCPDDCKAACGNGLCEPGETVEDCAVDCAPVCGDGTCQAGEITLCPQDCCSDCEDGLECTTGKCTGEGKVCAQLITPGFCLINNLCVAGGAAKEGAACLICQPVVDDDGWTGAEGKACDDSDPCTIADQCAAGVCSGVAKSCDDGNDCTLDYCDVSGECMHGAQPGSCDDGDACTEDDACVGGACAGIPYSCDDGLGCTVDQCLGGGSCGHVQTAASCLIGGQCFAPGEVDLLDPCLVCAPLAANDAWSANDGGPCNDGDPCTTGDLCSGGVCGGPPIDCPDDGDACTVESCTPGVGCQDAPLDCDDGLLCTSEDCDPAAGCTLASVDGGCDDGDGCTQDDACLGGECVGSPKLCDDADLCTSDSCVDGFCFNVDITLECDDATPCTNDFCTPALGCQNLANTAPCDDGDLCTGVFGGPIDTCADGACQPGATVECDDGLLCTTDFCVPSKGCTFQPNDAACNDFVPCTQDACQPGIGCTNTPVDSACDDGDTCTNDVCGDAGCTWDMLCGVTVIDESSGVVQSSDVLAVFAYDDVPDTQGSSWKTGTGAGWAAEAAEQLSGRALVLTGFSDPIDGPGYSDQEPPSFISLPLGGEASTAEAVSLELWFRISGLTPHYEDNGSGTTDHQLLIYDGSDVQVSKDPHCQNYGSARLDWVVGVGRWESAKVCLQQDSSSYTCGDSFDAEPYTFEKEQWHHLAIVRDPSNPERRYYANGALFGVVNVQNFLPSSKLTLAMRTTWGSVASMNVSVDEVKLYGAALSQAEIQEHRAADLAGQTDADWPDLLQRWSFDDPLDGPLETANGARRSDRSSDVAFPEAAWLIGTAQGLDIVDAADHSLWMSFEQNALGRSILASGVAAFAASDGRVFATGSGVGNDYELTFDPGQIQPSGSSSESDQSAIRWRGCPSESERLVCAQDECFGDSSQCGCLASAFETIACRNHEAFPQSNTDCLEGATTAVAAGWCSGGARIFRASSDGGFQITGGQLKSFAGYPAVDAMSMVDDTLYVAASKADGSCTRISLVRPNDCGYSDCPYNDIDCQAGERHLYAGSLGGSFVDPGTACGTPAEVVNDMVVTKGTSTANAAFNTLYLAGDARVAVVHEANHEDGGFDEAETTIWTAQGSGGGGFGVLPAGPYTSVVPCGGYVYVGTQSNGVVVVDEDSPAQVVAVYSEPDMPANEIRGLACTEKGALATMHRVLAATPSGAAEIGAISK